MISPSDQQQHGAPQPCAVCLGTYGQHSYGCALSIPPNVTPEHCDVPMTAYPIDFPEDTNPRVKQITRWRCYVCQTEMLLDWVSPQTIATAAAAALREANDG